MKFSIRIEDLELRSCGEHLLTEGVEHTRAEIVKWENEEYCWTLAYWNKNINGYNLMFVGNRPFDTNQEIFMKLAKQGQRLLDDAFDCELRITD